MSDDNQKPTSGKPAGSGSAEAPLLSVKCSVCPECGCADFTHDDTLGEGYRVCADCQQEWWINIDYAETEVERLSRLFNKANGSVLERVVFVAESMIGSPTEDDLQKFVDWMRGNFELPSDNR